MLCIAANESPDENADTNSKTRAKNKEQGPIIDTTKEEELNAATKGKGKGKTGSKGYGECWHGGEWGHARRECPHLNDPTNGKGSLGALKGGKGKGTKGTGGKGKGKSSWDKGSSYPYRSPGKGVGNGFNQMDMDRHNAWGSEYVGDHEYYYDDYNNGNDGDQGGIGYVVMMLEKGETTEEGKKQAQATTAGEFDALRRTEREQPITLWNRFEAFIEGDDSDDETDVETEAATDGALTDIQIYTKHKLNQRQRKRRKEQRNNALLDNTITRPRPKTITRLHSRARKEADLDDDKVQDTAANNPTLEEDWIDLEDLLEMHTAFVKDPVLFLAGAVPI